MSDRRAEDRHEPVAGELVDVTAELRYDVGQRRQDPVGDGRNPLGIEVFRPTREVGEVTEQHGDVPPLGLYLARRVAFPYR